MLLTQDQVLERLGALIVSVGDETDKFALSLVKDLVESARWCDDHGKPRLVLESAQCEDCLEVVSTTFAQHGLDEDGGGEPEG